jgi:hypothetical protein
MLAKRVLYGLAVLPVIVSLQSWSQTAGSDSGYLMRIERQTRSEDTCMLLQSDGHYHLERVVEGRPRVFEGTLESVGVTEVEPLLNAPRLVKLQQSDIDMTLISEDMDQFLLSIPRPAGWQTLNFPSGKSRKPYKDVIDPFLKWLDRHKQQQDPIVGAPTNRCMPSQSAVASSGTQPSSTNSANPYVMRVVVDHYEVTKSSQGIVSSSSIDSRLTRFCTIVYETGRYRMERSIQEYNSDIRSEIYKGDLSKDQLGELHKILDNPQLVALPNRASGMVFAREGEVTNLAIPRGNGVQVLSFASFFGARTQEKGMKDNTSLAVDANVELTHPIRKWIKQNVEEHKGERLKDRPATSCIPSAQPE